MNYTVRLLNLHCYRQDEDDGDEVFLKYEQEQIWPLTDKYHKMNVGAQVLNIDIAEIEIGSIINMELWDYDFWSSNDKLGIFSMLVNERGGPFTTDMKREKGSEEANTRWSGKCLR